MCTDLSKEVPDLSKHLRAEEALVAAILIAIMTGTVSMPAFAHGNAANVERMKPLPVKGAIPLPTKPVRK